MARGWGSWRALLRRGQHTSSPADAATAWPETMENRPVTGAAQDETFTVGGSSRTGRGPWPAVVAGLVALAIVLTLVELNVNKTSNNGALPPQSTTTTAPGTTSTIPFSVVLPPVTAAPKTAASGSASTTTLPKAAPVAASATTTTAVPTACTRQDLRVTTSTDKSTYAPGDAVMITTTITDVTACDFQPVADTTAGQPPCQTGATVGQQQADGSYTQVYPYTQQQLQCRNPQAQVMLPGATQYVEYTWYADVETQNAGGYDYPPAPDGTYQAYAIWNWAGPSGTVQAVVASPFSISG